jgi:hypothetical protein
MENAKYVCIDTLEGGGAVLIFPAFITHADFCQRYFGDKWYDNNKACREVLLSAGFVAQIGGDWKCIGQSSSLDLKSRPEDTNLLCRMLR